MAEAHWEAAHDWHKDLGLVYTEVDLGDVLTYEVLNVLGRIVIKAQLVPTSEQPNE